MRAAALAVGLLVAPAAAQPLPPDHPLRSPATETVPVPPERPPTPALGDAPRTEPAPAPVRPPAEPPAALSAAEHETCLAGLRDAGVVYEPAPAIADGACRAERPLRVTRLGGIALSAPVTALCRTTAALAAWVREDVGPAAEREIGAPLTEIRIGGSYECRNRNRQAQGPISEHAFANAVDVMGFAFRGRPVVIVAPPAVEPTAGDRFLGVVRQAACRHFTTVLGPGADAAHADHLHVDLRERRRGFRLCQ